MERSSSPVESALIAAFLSMLVIQAAIAGQVSCSLTFPQPTVVEIDGYHRVTIPEASVIGEPGAPALPSVGVWLLLPPGEKAVSMELRDEVWQSLPGVYRIEPVPEPRRFSDPSPQVPTMPDPSIYGGGSVYPSEPTGNLNTHLKRGYALATCLVLPVRWNPAQGTLEYMTRAEMTLQTTPGRKEQAGFDRFYRGDRKTREWAAARVHNPELLPRYPRRDVDEPEVMLVLTIREFMEQAGEYATWRNTRGMRTCVVACNQNDEPEDIRDRIISAYEELSIDYVLLLGDSRDEEDDNDPILLHRGLWCRVQNRTDSNIPADLYFAALDGDWDDNGNGNWGEPGEFDLMAEVIVGRVPAGNVQEVERGLNKVRLYSDEPVTEDVLTVLMLGENLGWPVSARQYMEEVYEGSNRYGYETEGFPERFEYNSLYHAEVGNWDGPDDLAPLLSEGAHLVHHLGHAQTRHVMSFDRDELDDDLIRNNGRQNGFNIAYSQGCYSGAFDNREIGASEYVGDCIAETFIHNLANGLVAFVCNSRFGWGRNNSTDGASQHFHREFVDALFGEDITVIGRANQDSKEDTAPWVSDAADDVVRWCYYEINLLGDPAMDIWTDEPREPDVKCVQALIIGRPNYPVTVEGVVGAVVCLSREGVILAVEVTDEEGVALLEMEAPVIEPGPVTLSVVAHNYLPFLTQLMAVHPDCGYPWVDRLTVVDTAGNGDGQVDLGEAVGVNPVVLNIGRQPLEGLTATVECDDLLATVINSHISYPDIGPESEELPGEPVQMEISPDCRDLHEVVLMLHMEDIEGENWSQEVSFDVHAPILGDEFLIVQDENWNDNGMLDPGEEIDLFLSIGNLGTGRAAELAAELRTDNPYIEVLEDSSTLAVLEPSGHTAFDEPFRVRVAGDCPNPYRAVFYIRLSGAGGFNRSFLDEVGIGGAFYSFDRGEGEWRHSWIEDRDYVDSWHLSDEDNHTPGGGNCIKLGSEEPGKRYEPDTYCAIYMPSFRVWEPIDLVFWHRIDSEDNPENSIRAYDGGYVETFMPGQGWVTIYPSTPFGRPEYPCLSMIGETNSPMGMDHPCYSGRHDWAPAIFDLSQFEGLRVDIRFVFGSDGSNEFGGWWIDDVELRLPTIIVAPTDLEGEIHGRGATLNWQTPSPLRDDDYIYPNELVGYRIYRRFDDQTEMLDTLVADNRYLDDLAGLPRGSYFYQVSAEYTTGESEPSELVELFWLAEVGREVEALPEEWGVSAVYPNPFNAVVSVVYSVAAPGVINLAVFDLQGRLVEELARGQHQPGRYVTMFNAEELSSGIYIVRMLTPAGAEFSRMVLIR